MALFGKQDKAVCQQTVGPPQTPHQQLQQEKGVQQGQQGVVHSMSYEDPRRHSPLVEKQLCPAIQKLMVRSADLHPLSELPENQPCRDGESCTGAAQPGSPCSTLGAPRTQNLLEKLQSSPRTASRCDPAAPAPSPSATTPAAPAPPVPGSQAVGSSEVSPRELLRKLQGAQQEPPVPSRPALAAKFPLATSSARAPNPLESWRDQIPCNEKQAPLLQVGVCRGGRCCQGLCVCSCGPGCASPSLFSCLGENLSLLSNPGAPLRDTSLLESSLCVTRLEGVDEHVGKTHIFDFRNLGSVLRFF